MLLGFLVQWSALLTLTMFSLLVVMYARLARSEEREAPWAAFGDAYRAYMRRVPAFFPRSRTIVGRPPAQPWPVTPGG